MIENFEEHNYDLNPIPDEELKKLEEDLFDFEERFPIEKLNAISEFDEDDDFRDVALAVFLEIQSKYIKLYDQYSLPPEFRNRMRYKLEKFSSAIGHFDSTTGKIVHRSGDEKH